ncbi:TPA: hypothetical protein NHP29_003399 [Pseudomonas aeruginosa]|nr:hypothetical protein [Pseudomonas aeruginosa]
MISTNKSIGDFISSESTLIAIIPFMGAYIAFVFEAGYASFFGVPIVLIQVDLVKIIISSAGVLLAIYLFLTVLGFIRTLVKGEHPIRRAFAFPLAATLVLSLFVIFSPIPYKIIIVASLFVVFCVSTFLPPLFKSADGKGYVQRLEDHIKRERSSSGGAEGLFRNLTEFFAFFFVASLFIFKAGNAIAGDKTLYYVLKESPGNVFVSNYGENMVFSVADGSDLVGEIVIVKLSDSSPISLVRKKLGPLAGVTKI